MSKELKKAIIEWLFENEKQHQIINACSTNFNDYIFSKQGNYLIGGEVIHDFIVKAENLIYSDR